jgi:hypothetical protein
MRNNVLRRVEGGRKKMGKGSSEVLLGVGGLSFLIRDPNFRLDKTEKFNSSGNAFEFYSESDVFEFGPGYRLS